MKKTIQIVVILFSCLFMGCSSSDIQKEPENTIRIVNYLALGDSYTIGQSVCETCRFPEQLKDSIKKTLDNNDVILVDVIAQTGWTTTNLKSAIASQNPRNDYDLVTLLIGVNNQYQNKPFSLYQQEFPELVNIAIQKAKGNKEDVIVVSIPDYAFTPFGNGNTTISNQIDTYNAFAENYCYKNNITFVNITDITRLGLTQTNLVASDGLHPSKLAYSKFVERILPKALLKINN
jgi:acyl-CoA thioesterase I